MPGVLWEGLGFNMEGSGGNYKCTGDVNEGVSEDVLGGVNVTGGGRRRIRVSSPHFTQLSVELGDKISKYEIKDERMVTREILKVME